MSLESGGHIITATIELTDQQTKCLIVDLEKDKPIDKKYDTYTYEPGGGQEVARKAFMETMEAFSHSDAFKALTYELNNEFSIKIGHQINLVMNRF